jgi:hypothetical protein
VEHCDFSHRQVNLAKSFPAHPIRGPREADSISWQERSKVLLDFSLGANLHSQSTFETIAFLRNRTFIGGDQLSLSDLRYRAALLSQSKASTAFVRFTRAFENPWRFAWFAAVTLLGGLDLYESILRVCSQHRDVHPEWKLPGSQRPVLGTSPFSKHCTFRALRSQPSVMAILLR